MAIDSPYVRGVFILIDRNGRQTERPSLIVSLITCWYADIVKMQEHKIIKTKHGELIRMLLPRRINNASFQVGGAVM